MSLLVFLARTVGPQGSVALREQHPQCKQKAFSGLTDQHTGFRSLLAVQCYFQWLRYLLFLLCNKLDSGLGIYGPLSFKSSVCLLRSYAGICVKMYLGGFFFFLFLSEEGS